MGRLLRKKKTVSFKRKRDEENGEPTPVGQEQLTDDSQTAGQAAQVEKKRIAPLQQKKAAPSPPKEGRIYTAMQFLREVRAELKKVTWPSRKHTIGSTLVVLVLVMVISAFLGMVDMTLSSLLQIVTQ